jgi:hypothetical protein
MTSSACRDAASMMLNLKAVRLRGALHALREFQDADHLVVHIEQSLVALAWPALEHIPGGVTIALGEHGEGKVLATDVAVDDAWVAAAKAQRVLLAREGEISSIDPSGKDDVHHLKVPGLPLGTFAAALDADEQHILMVVVRVLNFDFEEYGVAAADLTNGRWVREAKIGTDADLELLWDARLGAWVIGDTSRGSLWLWDGGGPAVKLAGPAAAGIHGATFTGGDDGVIASVLITQTTGETALITGHAERDRMIWTPAVTLSGSHVLMARRHPARALWACLAQAAAGQQIQIRDVAGKVLAEADLHPPAHLNNLLWSVSSPDRRVWGHGLHTLVAATLSE